MGKGRFFLSKPLYTWCRWGDPGSATGHRERYRADRVALCCPLPRVSWTMTFPFPNLIHCRLRLAICNPLFFVFCAVSELNYFTLRDGYSYCYRCPFLTTALCVVSILLRVLTVGCCMTLSLAFSNAKMLLYPNYNN